MSEIYAPGSLAGPQGPVGPTGSAAAISALAAAIMPSFASVNLFDQTKITTGTLVNGTDGSLTIGGQPTDTTALIYCPGATSMISNLAINAENWGGGVCLYDANGTFQSALPTAGMALANGGAIQGYRAFPLPGTQTYIRFGYVPSWAGSYNWTTAPNGMVYAVIAGTATLPASYQPCGLDTVAEVNAKDALVAANAATALAAALTGVTQTFAQAALPGPHGPNRNAFDYLSPIAGYINSSGGITASAGWNSAMVYAPGSTSAITNIPIWIEPGEVSVCTYDATGKFLADITSTLVPYSGSPLAPSVHLQPGVVFPLPGDQTYVKFSYNGSFAAWNYPGSAASCVFYSGTAAAPCPPSLTALNCSTPFLGNAPVNVKTASQLGCTIDGSLDCTAPLNAFLATASASNPIKLILDGMFMTTGLVLSPNGYTTIEGIGSGSGIFVLNTSNQDGIRIGAYTAATGCSEGAYNIALPARAATNIVLRNFTVNANSAGNTTGSATGITPANQPVAGAVAHGVYGVVLANCSQVVVDGMNFAQAPCYALCLSNAAFVTITNSTFISVGTLHDGIHIDGPSSDIGISDCYFSTGDDSIALNAPEGYGGDISRVTVTNCRFNGSLSVMRIYTSLDAAAMPSNNVHRVRDVAVSNCVGYTYNLCFSLGISGGGLTSTADSDQIQDLLVSNCTLSSPQTLATITVPIGSIAFRGVNFIPTSTAPVIQVWNPVSDLMLDGVTILRNADGNSAPNGLVSLGPSETIDRLSLLNCRVVDQEGASYTAVPYLVDVQGTVAAMRLEAIDLTHVAALTSGAGWAGVTTLRGGGVLGTGAQVPDAVMDSNALYLSSNAGGALSIKVGGAAKRLTLT